MESQQQDLIEIYEKSVSLYDRLDWTWVSAVGAVNEQKIAKRLEELTAAMPESSEAKLKQRFEWDNLDFGKVRSLLGDVKTTNTGKLPEWTAVLKEVPPVLEQIAAGKITIPEFRLEGNPSENKVPFIELLYPFVYIAEERLKKQAGADYQLLSRQAWHMLQKSLLVLLLNRFGKVLNIEFKNFKMRRNLQMDFQGGMFFGNLPFSSDDRYREFIKEMSAGKISGFFKEYSIVARMAAVSTQLWMESNTEFIQRLAGDR